VSRNRVDPPGFLHRVGFLSGLETLALKHTVHRPLGGYYPDPCWHKLKAPAYKGQGFLRAFSCLLPRTRILRLGNQPRSSLRGYGSSPPPDRGVNPLLRNLGEPPRVNGQASLALLSSPETHPEPQTGIDNYLCTHSLRIKTGIYTRQVFPSCQAYLRSSLLTS
jgi:hypothetical protein